MHKKENNFNQIKIAKFILKKSETSKQEISSKLGLSMPTVLQNVKELIQMGMVTETGKYESTGGRKAAVLSIAEGFQTAVGIDITANHISYVLIDFSGIMLAKKRIKQSFENTPDYHQFVADQLDRFLLENHADQEKILGVGISLPGIIDKTHSVLIRSHVLKQNHMSLKAFSQRIPYPVFYENDANSALFSEIQQINTDMIYLSLSNSVGGAIYLNGKIVEGDHHRSAEFGHMILEPNGTPCYCGKKGCADAYCSATVLQAHAASLEDFFEQLQKGNRTIQAVWDRYLEHLSILITNLRMAFDCDIMLGGYIGGYLKQYLPELSRKAIQYNQFEDDTLYLKCCTHDREASAIGVAMTFFETYLNSF